VDANGSFDRRHLDELLALDTLDLAYIEQPLGPLDLSGSATLQSRISTPVCLDESVRRLGDIVTIAAAAAASAIVIKPGRLGPTLAARALALATRHHLDVKIGGPLPTGVGKALDVAVATHPQVSLPCDLAATGHWFDVDLVAPPWRLHDGAMAAPTGPGLGIEVLLDRVESSARRHLRMPS
jgi:O-succinylbenzoate synthase